MFSASYDSIGYLGTLLVASSPVSTLSSLVKPSAPALDCLAWSAHAPPPPSFSLKQLTDCFSDSWILEALHGI